MMRPVLRPGEHPIETQDYILPVPGIYAFSAFVQQSLRLNKGGMMYSLPRFGKTKSIKYIRDELFEILGNNHPIFRLQAESDSKTSRKKFWGVLLDALDHSVGSGDELERKKRILKFLKGRILETGASKVILFIDEAQDWNINQYTWLAELGNVIESDDFIENKHISFIVFLVGQPQLIHLRNSFKTSEGMKIVSRYMVRTLHLHGIRNPIDMAETLDCYDYHEYPKNSGYSYSRYYCESVYDFGWRLKNEAEKLWNAFKGIREDKKVAVYNEVPIEYLARTVEFLFLDFQIGSNGFTFDDCKAAVIKSEYVTGSDYIVEPKLLKEEVNKSGKFKNKGQ